MEIQNITSRPILDSRGKPTIETTVHLDVGISATASVPSGASTGSHEAVELRDGDPKQFGGQGVKQAIANVTGPIQKALKGHDVRQQSQIDQAMIDLDGTVNKSKLGANAILSVSLAVARAAAALERKPLYRSLQEAFELPEINPKKLPRPMMNVLNGGRHADTDMPVQEFMVVPNGKSVLSQIETGTAIYRALQTLLHEKHMRTTVGDEGGFAPAISDPKVALEFLVKAITTSGHKLAKDVDLALDVAASELFDPATKRYRLGDTTGGLSATGVTSLLGEWAKEFSILSIEDGLAEDDWEGWHELTSKLGKTVKLIGDDLFVTNASRLQRGIDSHVANGILIKLNQIGTVTETMKTIRMGIEAGYTPVISHRSGETSDAFIADLAVAVSAPFIKAGAPARGERVAKYNRLLEISEELTA